MVDEGDWDSRWPSRASVTVRLEWYRQSLDVMAGSPILGVGTGAFPRQLAENAGRSSSYPPNPHNEYLAIGMQTGAVGLLLLLYLFWRQLATAPRLATPMDIHLARALVIAIGVGSLFNSCLLDHTEGLFFAWFTGLLYAGLVPPAPPSGIPRP